MNGEPSIAAPTVTRYDRAAEWLYSTARDVCNANGRPDSLITLHEALKEFARARAERRRKEKA